MASKKIQLYTDRDKTIEASPETSANCVILSDGNDLQKVLDNDLTTPTVVHEETSFKVGVGDVNVSSSVVDGEVGRMVIKGKTYQNILPEPSLRNSMTNGKSMQKLNEGYENVNVVDGVAKSAILKGNTLVNLSPFTNKIALSPSNISETKKVLQTLNQNTKYILIFNINNSTSSLASNYIMVRGYNTDGAFKEYGRTIKNFGNGRHYILLESTEGNVERIFIGSDFSCEIDDTILAIYQDGMENWDIPYFEGMQSVRMPVLTTTGKNLWNNYHLERGSINHLNGENLNQYTTQTRSKDYIPIVPNTKYIATSYSFDGTTSSDLIRYYDSEKKFIGISPNEKSTFLRTVFQMDIDNISHIQLEPGTVATSYEPYKSNILSTPEDLELRGIGEVKDTLNLNTGEYVQRIKEMVLNGSENYTVVEYIHNNTNLRFDLYINEIKSTTYSELLCDSLPVLTDSMLPEGENTKSYIASHANGGRIVIIIEKSKLPSENIEGFKTWLQANPITVQYKLTIPIVKTVDLSSYGNWEKVVLNGSEDGWGESFSNWNNKVFCLSNRYIPNVIAPTDVNFTYAIGDKLRGCNIAWLCAELGRTGVALHHWFEDYLQIAINGVNTVDELKQYLSQNPITVWYQTETSQANSIAEMLSFSNGHIQVSSEEGSLIPSLDYEVPTSNSYHMDLMKANTRYTMKAKSASGNLTIDGTSYGAGTNGTFTTPTLMTNKLLIMSNNTNEEVMILEGDEVSKTIPYFKGIKSTFEDESKIEVLSTGKNLFDGELFKGYFYGNIGSVHTIKTSENAYYTNTQKVKPNAQYLISFIGKTEKNFIYCRQLDKNGVTLNETSQNFANGYMRVNTVDNCCSLVLCTHANYEFAEPPLFQIEESSSSISTAYEPYKSNSTKIPLLSPLRSLPNGVYDELIIDRMKKKATIVQRVGCGTLGQQGHGYNVANSTIDTSLYQPWYTHDLGGLVANVQANQTTMWSDKFLVETTHYVSKKGNSIHQYSDDSANFVGCILKSTLGAKTVQQWFEANNVTVYYQLKTPIVTEVDLDKYPFIYKDGHIFLNSEIAPVVEIAYNVNQTQQIQANNETLQRHELDILDLDNLIVSFVNAEYNLRLLKFDMELSMMALAE